MPGFDREPPNNIVNLVIPTLNDDMQDVRQMLSWITENIGPEGDLSRRINHCTCLVILVMLGALSSGCEREEKQNLQSKQQPKI
jgi:hypothetical protein